MRNEYKAYKKVGKLKKSISELLKLDFSPIVYASPGVIRHIKKRHGKQLTKKVKENIIETIEIIMKNPDYFGLDYMGGNGGSLELVKKIDNILLLGLDVDLEDKYIYVATIYPITESKLNARIHSGRLIAVEEFEIEEKVL